MKQVEQIVDLVVPEGCDHPEGNNGVIWGFFFFFLAGGSGGFVSCFFFLAMHSKISMFQGCLYIMRAYHFRSWFVH